MKKILFLLLTAVFAFAACSESDSEAPQLQKFKKRTIIAYITADNNISNGLLDDIAEMKIGARKLSKDCNLIAFIDAAAQKPYIAMITADSMQIVKKWDNDFYTTDPDSMLSVFQWIIESYPALEYATIFEGHGTGAIINKDTLKNEFFTLMAYGYDKTGSGSSIANKFINIPTLAKVLNKLPHMQFIFFDCCCMANIETVYELRNSTDYVIALASETAAKGAPYNTIVPLLSLNNDVVGDSIIKHYVEDSNFGDTIGGVCLSYVKTSELTALKDGTKTLLQKLYAKQKQDNPSETELIIDREHCIYYYDDNTTRFYPVLHDMKSVFRHALDEKKISSDDYEAWLKLLNNAVNQDMVSRYMPNPEKNDIWTTDRYYGPNIKFNQFRDYFTKDYYGALSMIFPTPDYDWATLFGYPSVNQTMLQLEWCNAVGWKEYGW